MRLGIIADDFTGATDIGNTLAKGGMATRLFTGPTAVNSDCDAGVVALKSRSIGAEAAIAQSLAALKALREAGATQIVFKYCSTFDSTPAGNIGPVAEALALALGARGVVVCPAFPATGRTVYQGHLFVGDRLISESGMAQHPLTPMTDPDLVRWLGFQTQAPPGLVTLATVRAGPAAIAAALAAGPLLSVVDAVSDADLRAIGAAVADAPLVTGGSGVAIGLPDNFPDLCRGSARNIGTPGPALLLAGSCSATTRAQVAQHSSCYPALALNIDALMAGAPVTEECLAFAARHHTGLPMIYSTADAATMASAQQRYGAAPLAAAIEAAFGAIAIRAVGKGVTRLVVGGGETSGAIVEALGLQCLNIGPEIAPGVPAVGAPGLALALKSGNFGNVDFFATAAAVLAQSADGE